MHPSRACKNHIQIRKECLFSNGYSELKYIHRVMKDIAKAALLPC